MTKTGLVRRRRIGHCDLFDICNLWFGIFAYFSAPKPLVFFSGKAIESWRGPEDQVFYTYEKKLGYTILTKCWWKKLLEEIKWQLRDCPTTSLCLALSFWVLRQAQDRLREKSHSLKQWGFRDSSADASEWRCRTACQWVFIQERMFP